MSRVPYPEDRVLAPGSLLLATRRLIERFSYANCREQPQQTHRCRQIVAALIFIAVISYKYPQSETDIGGETAHDH